MGKQSRNNKKADEEKNDGKLYRCGPKACRCQVCSKDPEFRDNANGGFYVSQCHSERTRCRVKLKTGWPLFDGGRYKAGAAATRVAGGAPSVRTAAAQKGRDAREKEDTEKPRQKVQQLEAEKKKGWSAVVARGSVAILVQAILAQGFDQNL